MEVTKNSNPVSLKSKLIYHPKAPQSTKVLNASPNKPQNADAKVASTSNKDTSPTFKYKGKGNSDDIILISFKNSFVALNNDNVVFEIVITPTNGKDVSGSVNVDVPSTSKVDFVRVDDPVNVESDDEVENV